MHQPVLIIHPYTLIDYLNEVRSKVVIESNWFSTCNQSLKLWLESDEINILCHWIILKQCRRLFHWNLTRAWYRRRPESNTWILTSVKQRGGSQRGGSGRRLGAPTQHVSGIFLPCHVGAAKHRKVGFHGWWKGGPTPGMSHESSYAISCLGL